MTRPSPRLSASISSLNRTLPQTTSRHVCLQCRYRATLQQSQPSPLRVIPKSVPSIQRKYASTGIDRLQDGLTGFIAKRIFKKGEGEIVEQPPEDGAVPVATQESSPTVEDADYTPAVTGDMLERVGGPSGWWEEAWDERHQFSGYEHCQRPVVNVH